MNEREALKLALEAFDEINKLSVGENAICLPAEIDTAMDACRKVLAQPGTWVGLTDEEFQYCVELKNPESIAEEVEAKLKEKNT